MLDGNSLSYASISAVLSKPWEVPSDEPAVGVLDRDARHPIPGLPSPQRKSLRDLVHKGQVVVAPAVFEAAK